MKTVHILEPFTGYPSGKKRAFAKGEEPELPNDFADLIVKKGHARELTLGDKPATKRVGE
ncbi:hypothetical protein [Terrihabitans sp. B22-R8]|uniref:hypothetical protein n=1 Tax=Terrihabitans sp. B22-R8 TaxID=3425128 RepID=UPI00403C6730